MLVTGMLSVLNGSQRVFADRFSQLVMRESTDTDQTSSDRELSDWEVWDFDFTSMNGQKKSPIDDRLLELVNLRIRDRIR